VHILYLVGFYNRFLVMFRWAWSYLTFQRGARLITNITPTAQNHAPPSDEARVTASAPGGTSSK
jgi:NADH dehydrogenase